MSCHGSQILIVQVIDLCMLLSFFFFWVFWGGEGELGNILRYILWMLVLVEEGQ